MYLQNLAHLVAYSIRESKGQFPIFSQSMRIVAIFLSILIFLFSVMPCGDAVAGPIATTHFQEGSSESHQHSHQDGDNCCSPFCQCACCALLALPITNLQVSSFEVISFAQPIYFSSAIDFLLAWSNAVWQPPKA